MLDVENEIGEDLVKFGAHIREATQLMQAQITAAFTGEEVTVPQVAPCSLVSRAVIRGKTLYAPRFGVTVVEGTFLGRHSHIEVV